jgi:hypothetical protein
MAATGEPSRCMADDRERFNLLYDQLKTIRSTIIDGLLRGAAVLMVVVGWAITSDSARAVMAGNATAQALTIAVAGVYAIAYLIVVSRASGASVHIAGLLDAVGYMPKSHYVNLVITRTVAMPHIVLNVVLIVAFIANVLQIAR